jgi:hypothetical protein
MSNGLHPCSISSKESESTLVLQPIPSPIEITMTNGITMTNAVIECILSRSAAKYYDPAVTLSDDQIRELVRIGTTAPTSFHMQNWRFIAVRSLKPRLGCVRSLGISPPSPMQPLPSSSAASRPIPA